MFALTFLFATAEDVFVFFAGVFVLGLDLDLAFAFGLGDADLALGDADRPLGEVDLLLLRVETAMARQRFIFLLSLFSSFFLSFQISLPKWKFPRWKFPDRHTWAEELKCIYYIFSPQRCPRALQMPQTLWG